MVWHNRCCYWWSNFSFAFWEEQTFNSKLKHTLVNLWGILNRPIKFHIVIDFCLSLLLSNQFIQCWCNLCLKFFVDLRSDLVTNSSHEKRFEERCKFSNNVTVNTKANVTFWEINSS